MTSFKARLNPDEKKRIDKRIEEQRIRLQVQVDEHNRGEIERCRRVNNSVDTIIANKIQALAQGNEAHANEYFSAVLKGDNFSLDCQYRYEINFSARYIQSLKRLVIDYRLPTLDEISDTKEWKVSKGNELVAKPFTKSEFLVLYEKIVLDLSIRIIGMVFDSDDQGILSEIVFNGSCIYDNTPEDVVFIISVLVTKKKFRTSNIRRADFSSKAALSKFSQVVYLGDIHADAPPKALADKPPMSGVIPIQSNLYRQ